MSVLIYATGPWFFLKYNHCCRNLVVQNAGWATSRTYPHPAQARSFLNLLIAMLARSPEPFAPRASDMMNFDLGRTDATAKFRVEDSEGFVSVKSSRCEFANPLPESTNTCTETGDNNFLGFFLDAPNPLLPDFTKTPEKAYRSFGNLDKVRYGFIHLNLGPFRSLEVKVRAVNCQPKGAYTIDSCCYSSSC